MTLGIIGGTKLSISLGNKYLSRGLNVVFGVREEFEAKQIEWKILKMQNDKVFGYCEAMEKADVILICCENEYLPLVCQCLSQYDKTDKIVLDCTNGNYNPNFACNTCYIQENSGYDRVLKGFNNLGLDYPKSDPLELVKETYFCGDNESDKFKVKKLIELIGFKAVDAGNLNNAPLLEAFYHLRKQISHQKNENIDYHFKLMSV
ncbi:NADPH-dependent F420 reductase [Echinicola shivajiensis]|uniref:NADPH-dependent F420 reductase n=1 Tax=Echinicola shivajiensis TaxID=1035916 RepID=UPI001BFC0196|nr:NAD(P)-binding domain-containing protein [Echinicola shivajiensis]